MLRLATLVLAVSAVFAAQVPNAEAMLRHCSNDRECPHGDYCRIHPLGGQPGRRGICERRTHSTPRGDDPVATPPPGASQTMCPMIYQPVCGVDGKTYPNQCHATRAGAKVSHPGSC